MTRLTAFVLFSAFALLIPSGERVGAAPVPKHLMKAGERDLAALQGKWELAGLESEGTALPPDVIEMLNQSLEFQGDRSVMIRGSQGLRTVAVAKLDTTAAPSRIAFCDDTVTDLNGNPEKALSGKAGAVIYKLNGDALVLAAVERKGDKWDAVPKDFVSKPGSNSVILTFKRVK